MDGGGEEGGLVGEGEVLVDVLEAGFPVPSDVAADGGDPGGVEQRDGGAQDGVVNEHVVSPGDGWDGPCMSPRHRWRGGWGTWCSSTDGGAASGAPRRSWCCLRRQKVPARARAYLYLITAASRRLRRCPPGCA